MTGVWDACPGHTGVGKLPKPVCPAGGCVDAGIGDSGWLN